METLPTYIEDNSMTHSMLYNPQTRIIETIVEGMVNSNEFKEIFSQAVQLAKEKKCFLFLNDFRKSTFAMSTMDFYNLPKILSGISTSQGIHANRLRRAIVVAPKDTMDASFAEDVTVNCGQHAKIFLEIDQAREWLLGRSLARD